MKEIPSYPSVFNLGHRALKDLFLDPVFVQEKIDGSQISFGLLEGGLVIRSKGAPIYPDCPDKLFKAACETIVSLNLRPGWIYRGEYLTKPKHNTLAYGRVPVGNIIIFDIDDGNEQYLGPLQLKAECERIGLEVVPELYYGVVGNSSILVTLLDKESLLGNTKIEGVAIKNYARFGLDKKILIGKLVSEAFKEVHQGEWRKANPTVGDVVTKIIEQYKTEARWEKAIQHLRDAGLLEDSPRDIGMLIREVPNDVMRECENEIVETLWKHFWPKIARGLTGGLPEWYKKRLLGEQKFFPK